MKEKLIFKKGIHTIHIPFLLHGFTPWQEQIGAELQKLQAKYAVSKSARWGFEITEHGASIKVYKS